MDFLKFVDRRFDLHISRNLSFREDNHALRAVVLQNPRNGFALRKSKKQDSVESISEVAPDAFMVNAIYHRFVNRSYRHYFPSFSISLIFSVRASSTSTRSPHLRFRQNCSRSAQFSACRMLRSLIA